MQLPCWSRCNRKNLLASNKIAEIAGGSFQRTVLSDVSEGTNAESDSQNGLRPNARFERTTAQPTGTGSESRGSNSRNGNSNFTFRKDVAP